MLTLKDIIKETQGTLLSGALSAKIQGVSIDSRTLKKGELFIAIKGANFDGHSFIKTVIKKGAGAVVISRESPGIATKIPVIRVSDTTKALGQIARFHRRNFKIPVVAITGSNGKTTTKEMVSEVLNSTYRVLKNPATENNFIGVPLTLLRLRKSHQAAVLELGTNHPGEIRWLTQVVEPTICILMNIGDSHLEFLHNRTGVFKEKYSMVTSMPKRGRVIFNNDDPFLRTIASKRPKHRLIHFGIDNRSHYQATQITFKKNNSLLFTLNNQESFYIKTITYHNVYNALAAISCGRLFKINYNKIRRVLSKFQFLKGRQAIRSIGPIQVIDDTYNSNPTSFRSAIKTLGDYRCLGRKILVLGDMLELGRSSERLHREVGEQTADIKPDLVLTFGRYSRFINLGLKKRNQKIKAFHYLSLAEMNHKLLNYLKPGDVILLKGSRGMRMERVAQFLENKFGGN